MHTKRLIDTDKVDADEFGARVLLLENDAREALWLIMQKVLLALENDGCVVCAFDTRNTGTMSVAAVGNQELVFPLMEALSEIHEAYTSNEGEVIQ